jgi:hypothetical protein
MTNSPFEPDEALGHDNPNEADPDDSVAVNPPDPDQPADSGDTGSGLDAGTR